MGLTCTVKKCSRISFIGINILFSLLGAALLIASCIVRYDQRMADKYLGYSSFQKALERANVSVHTPSSLNIGETLDVVCIVFIVIGVLFLLVGILGIIGGIVRIKALLITYAVVLLVLVLVELICVILVATLRGKMEGWIKDALKDSIRNDYSGIDGNDTDTLRWNFIMHSFQCCGVDRYTDFRELPARKWDVEIDTNNIIVVGKQIPFACCHEKNDVNCVLRPNNSRAFIGKGCYQVMKNWVTNNTSVMVGVGASILVIELILVVLAFVICCTLRNETYGRDEDMDPIQPYKLPHAHLVSRNQDLFYLSGVINNPVYVGPTWYDSPVEIHPLRQSRELFNNYNQPLEDYDKLSHDQDTCRGSLGQNESYEETSLGEPLRTSFTSRLSSEVPYAKPWKKELRNKYPEAMLPLKAQDTLQHLLQNTSDESYSTEVKTHKNISSNSYSSNV